MTKLSKRGITLIELLGALVLSGIAISLIALLLTFFGSVSQDTLKTQKLNGTGIYVVTLLETRMKNFGPTDYEVCDEGDYCVILYQAFYYDYINDEILLTIHDVPLSLTIFIENNNLYIDNQIVNDATFSIQNESYFEIITNNNEITVLIKLNLLAFETETADFLATYRFTSQPIPQN